jgi:hypothetical protein
LAAPYSKFCHLYDKDVSFLAVLTEKGGRYERGDGIVGKRMRA